MYEQIRPLVLFHETAGERAKEIDIPQRTLSRKADEFEKYGMQSLFASEEHGGARESSKALSPGVTDCEFSVPIHGALAKKALLPNYHFLDSGHVDADLLVKSRYEKPNLAGSHQKSMLTSLTDTLTLPGNCSTRVLHTSSVSSSHPTKSYPRFT